MIKSTVRLWVWCRASVYGERCKAWVSTKYTVQDMNCARCMMQGIDQRTIVQQSSTQLHVVEVSEQDDSRPTHLNGRLNRNCEVCLTCKTPDPCARGWDFPSGTAVLRRARKMRALDHCTSLALSAERISAMLPAALGDDMDVPVGVGMWCEVRGR